MPLLPTSQAYLEQSALLLEAYPDTTRITTKYNFPSSRPSNTSRKQKSKSASSSSPATTTTETTTTNPPQPTPTPPLAYLTLKTYNPTTGICLKYRTNKAAEVGRLITSLGKLAAGATVAELGLSNPVPAAAAPAAADVEMTDAPEDASGGASTPVPAAAAAKGDAAGGGKGGKGKKKGGKGKR